MANHTEFPGVGRSVYVVIPVLASRRTIRDLANLCFLQPVPVMRENLVQECVGYRRSMSQFGMC